MKIKLRSVIARTVAICFVIPTIWAQSSDQSPATHVFEAAAIKPMGPDVMDQRHGGGPGTDSPTLYRQSGATVLDMVRVAWNVRPFQVVSASNIDRERFDLVARLPQGATRDEFREMLRSLLAERFALKTHMETREMSAYEMRVAKGGLRVKPVVEASPPDVSDATKPDSPSDWRTIQPGKRSAHVSEFTKGGINDVLVQVQLHSFGELALMLQHYLDLPIVDNTGLKGEYTYNLEFSTDIPGIKADEPPEAPDLFVALRRELGIDLVKSKMPTSVVVVDSVRTEPTAN